ncbi:uncharacterized protein LOC130135341 [Syzygium oleosum]|uniref:uncharacterized protein LOC130135341 n=1 Tax=Syzygium oleosum TaxID=219896 RepID=UPI0024BB02D3|nr:uncharacterized protein LOC130135341 [Syzygium oleosum]
MEITRSTYFLMSRNSGKFDGDECNCFAYLGFLTHGGDSDEMDAYHSPCLGCHCSVMGKCEPHREFRCLKLRISVDAIKMFQSVMPEKSAVMMISSDDPMEKNER